MKSKLRLRRLGIDTYRENVVYMPKDCEICKSQGFDVLSKLEVHSGRRSILATLNTIENGMLHKGELGLSNVAFRRLGVAEGETVALSHPTPLTSTDYVRRKLDGISLTRAQIFEIVKDIAAYRYSNIELTAFVVACAKRNLSEREIVDLTRAMIATGEQIDWGLPMVLDKHCIGGIPGNRTTMVVVPIVAAYGLSIPKTSSRAITSPSGTADTMEAITNVRLSLLQMKKIVREEGACIAWGGSISLAPADDIIISVERPLSLDSEGQMIASILSKKKAAGSTHVLLDIPVGPTAKVTTFRDARRLKRLFESIGRKIGLRVLVVYTDGHEPIGNGIGPSLEAADVLKVLRNEPGAPSDLKKKSLMLAGTLLEFSGRVPKGQGIKMARRLLETGQAYEKFLAIARRQGPLKNLSQAKYNHVVKSPRSGRLLSIHNQKMAKVARLAGAPTDPRAGVYLHAKIGDVIKKGSPLFRIDAEHEDELNFALHYVEGNDDIVGVRPSSSKI